MRGRGRFWVCLLLIAAVLGSGWMSSAGAQDATPDDTRSSAGGAPAETGASVTYVDAEGIEHGVVTVLEIVDPFTEFAEGYEPDDGARYVMLNVSFEATGDRPFDTNPNDVLMRDADGFLWSPASVNRGSEPELPDAQSQVLASGNLVSGAITFQVPEDTPVSQIFYQPESGHLILLADLADGDERPAAGDAVTYVDAEGIEYGAVTVTEVIDPFTDYSEGYEPQEGARYVVLHVFFEATGDEQFDADPGDLLIRDANGFLWSRASVNMGSDPDVPEAESQTLSAGNRISGAVGFIVPADVDLAQIYYQPESGHLILLAELGGEA